MSRLLAIIVACGATLSLSACKVETTTEKIPEAEGSGKNAVNIRVEPMNREEIKDAASTVIDKTADVAGEVKDATVAAKEKLDDVRIEVTTRTEADTSVNTPSPAPSATAISTPADNLTTASIP